MSLHYIARKFFKKLNGYFEVHFGLIDLEPTSFLNTLLSTYSFSIVYVFQVDEIAIPYLGYLPQELEGSDTFNYYHPGDLVYIKEAYENIVSDQGKPFKSRAYRFKAKNGCYLTLETVWSCFINPWSKKLEFVDAKHTIIKGPTNKDIFAEPGENTLVVENVNDNESSSTTNATTLEEDRKQV